MRMRFLHRHCEANEATGGSFIRRSNPLRFGELQRIASSALLRFAAQCFLAMTVCSTVFAQSRESKLRVLNQIASVPSRNDFAMVAARIYLGKDTANAHRQLDTLLSRAYGDMFWMYGCAGLYYATSDRLRPEYKARIRSCWKHCTPYRGDTENHSDVLRLAVPDGAGVARFAGYRLVHGQIVEGNLR